MWKCPKCGRSFSREGQGHYCGRIETVDQYIEQQDETVRAYLNEVRRPDHPQRHSGRTGEDLVEYADILEGAEPHSLCGVEKASGTLSGRRSNHGFC